MLVTYLLSSPFQSEFVKSYFFVLSAAVQAPESDENFATAAWFVGMMCAIALLLLLLIIIFLVKRNRGGKYSVHEKEAAQGRDLEYPEDGGFNEYTKPYVSFWSYFWKLLLKKGGDLTPKKTKEIIVFLNTTWTILSVSLFRVISKRNLFTLLQTYLKKF